MLKEYNEGKRADRQIKDYLKYVSDNKKNDVATGYQRGMKKQLAKTKVFTKGRMEQLQDLLHDQAEKLIQEHPEIFGDETLKPKEKGRNNDMSKEFYIRMKQKQYEEIFEEITKLEVERDNLIETQNEIINATDKMVDEVVEKMADTEMKKEFMRYALLDEPRTPIGKIVSTAFKKFKEWWEQERKPRIIDETKESVLEKLRNFSNKRIDKNKEKKQFINKIDMER